MKFSTSAVAVALLSLGVSAAPVAQAKAADLPGLPDVGGLVGGATGGATGGLPDVGGLVGGATGGATGGLPDVGGLVGGGLPGLPDLGGLAGNLTNISGGLGDLTNIVGGGNLPAEIATGIIKIVVELLNGIIDALGSATGLTAITDTITNLLDQALSGLDTLGSTTGNLSKRADITDAIEAVKNILTTVVSSVIAASASLLSLNLIGVVTALLGGALTILAQLLSVL